MAVTATAQNVPYISMIGFWIMILSSSVCGTFVLPEFQLVPQSVVYYTTNNNPINKTLKICCDIWPKWPIGRLTYYSTYHFHHSFDNTSNQSFITTTTHMIAHQRIIYHVPSDFTCDLHLSNDKNNNKTLKSENCLCFSNVTSVELFTGEKFYCLASTDFGSIISKPFQIALKTEKTSIFQKLVYHFGNIAILPCNLEKIYLSDQIFFTFNNKKIAVSSDNKYRLVQPTVTSHTKLLIRNFNFEDQGFYQCGLLDTKLKTERYDRITYHLLVDVSPNPSLKNVLYMNLDGSLLDIDAVNDIRKPIEIIAYESQNITLPCVFSSPKPYVPNVSRVIGVSNGNQKFDALFGVLDIYSLSKNDEGLYFCTVNNITSYAYLKVLPLPQLIVYPQNIKTNIGDSINLSCISSIIDMKPIWYFNGIPVQSTVSINPYHTSLLINSMQLSNVGIYQCILGNDVNNIWIDGISTIILHEQSLFTKDEFNSALSKVTFPLSHDKIELLEVEIGIKKQLTCLSQYNLGPYHQIVDDIAKTLHNLLPIGNSNSLLERLNISCLLNLIHVKWLKVDGPNSLLLINSNINDINNNNNNASSHKLQCSTLYVIDINVTRSTDFGLYSCNIYFGEQLVYERYFRLMESVILSHSLNSDIEFNHSTNKFTDLHHRSFKMMDSLSHNGQVTYPLYRTRRSQEHRVNKWSSSSEHIGTLPLLNLSFPRSSYEHLYKPNATTVGDNLAVLISWNSINCDFYRIVLRSHIPESDGLFDRSTIGETVEECCSLDTTCCLKNKHFYLTNRHPGELIPGKSYQFRINAIKQINNDDRLVDKSPWSETVSFQHISKVAPVITETERLSDGGILTRWTLATSAVGFPIDHFLLLYRPEERSANGRITYNGFKAVFVDGSNATEHKLQALESGKGYQIVVYGVHTPPGFDPQSTIFTGGLNGRKITQFSHEVFVKPRSISLSTNENLNKHDSSTLRSISKSRELYNSKNVIAFNSNESNRLMFLIFGALTGAMLLIMICLVVLCIWRQRQRDKHCLIMNNSTNGCNVISCNSSMNTVDKSLKKTGFSGTGGFLLDNLNTASLMTSSITSCGNQVIDVNVEQLQYSDRTTLPHQRSRPPPMSPAPPPPSNIPISSFQYFTRNENFELKSLMLDSDNSYNHRQFIDNMSKSVFVTSSNFYPNNLPSVVTSLSSSPVFCTMINCKGHDVVVNNSLPKSHLLLATPSSTGTVTVGVSSNKSIGTVNRMDNLTNHEMSNYLLQSSILNGLKREPPSGGSVHDGTDDESVLSCDKNPKTNLSEYPHSNEFCSYSYQNPTVSHSSHHIDAINNNVHVNSSADETNSIIVVPNRGYNLCPNNNEKYHSMHQVDTHSNPTHCYHCQKHCHPGDSSCSPNIFVNVDHMLSENYQVQQYPSNIMFTSTIPNYDPGLLTPPSSDIVNVNEVHNDNNSNSTNYNHNYSNNYATNLYDNHPCPNVVLHTRRRHPRSNSCQFNQPQQSLSPLFIHPAMITSYNNSSEKNVKYFGLSQPINHYCHHNHCSIPCASNSQQNFNVYLSKS
ncbi:hypothetical protein Smp_196920 [Schistosoma mansoni]|uniref:hypothetical protein n=1 Tax=Schistosoma mansoni TaxID=6183 RepID=UPI00022DC5F7|nr:hypothetical protein Smp_196920 [Schistosoma mansoni]|eukprot:XP_018649459.1 hypothetical protein Smp_196920 [Schistosoma mansoni]